MPRVGRGKGATTVQSFHLLLSKTMSSGSAFAFVTCTNLGNRALSEADAWTLWRVRSFRFRILSDSTHSAATPAAFGVQEGAPNTVASTVATILDLWPSVLHCGTGETTWSRWVTVPSSVCAGEFSWYQTLVGTFTQSQATPFTIVWAGSTSGVIQTEFYFTLEFKSQANTSDTPAALLLRQRVREERALGILASDHMAIAKALAVPCSPSVVQKT